MSSGGVVVSLLALVLVGWVSAAALFIISALGIAVIVSTMAGTTERPASAVRTSRGAASNFVLRVLRYGRLH